MSKKPSKFVRICNSLYEGGKMVPIESWHEHIKDVNSDWYRSVGTYTPEQVEKFRSQKHLLKSGAKGEGKVAGITGVKTDFLVLDFDNEDHPEISQKDTIEVVDKLTAMGISFSNYNVTFSGNKGFSIELYLDKEYTSRELKTVAENLTTGLSTWDSSLYDENQILRVPGTKHPKSGLYKITLSESELKDLTITEIKSKAKKVEDINYVEFPNKLPIELFKTTKKEAKVITVSKDKLDFALKPTEMPKWKYAILNGWFPPGKRHDSMLALASYFKGMGFPIEQTQNLVLTASRLQYERYKDKYSSDPTDEGELTRTIEHIYGPTWTGGIYAYEANDQLKDSIMELFPNETDLDKQTEKTIITVPEMHNSFNDFAKNIKFNKIYTGIKELDDRILLTTSMAVGILGSPGCHAKGTRIIMSDGSLKNVEDVKVGDFLMGPDSKPREVLKTIVDREEMVKINPHRSESFIVNKNHILHLEPSKQKNKKSIPCPLHITVDTVIKAKEEYKSQVIAGYKLKKTGIELEEKELPLDPYFLGLWLGDGTASKPEITNMDPEIEKYLIEYTRNNGYDLQIYDRVSSGKARTFSIKKGMLNKLRELNLLNNKHIPDIFLKGSKEQRLQLLAGLIDTDGYYDKLSFKYSITQKNKNLAKQIQFLARSIGYHCSLTEKIGRCYYKGVRKEGIYQTLYISGNIRLPVLIKRKQINTDIRTTTDHTKYGYTYEKLGIDDYYGFTISGDHLYLTEDFFIHHNSGKTSILLNLLQFSSQNDIPVMFFSLDMAQNMVFAKLISRETGISFENVIDAFEKNDPVIDQWAEILGKQYKNVGFYFRSGTSVEDIRREILKHQQKIGQRVKMIAIDYFELLVSNYGSDALANSSMVSNKIKDLTTDLDICTITLVQPPKSAGDPSSPLTSMRQVKGASTLEQNFRVILGMYREGFNPASFENDKFATIVCLKNTFGPLFTVDLGWDGVRGRVYSLDENGRKKLKQIRQEKEGGNKDDDFSF
jgi:replicative DNA helicase